VADSSDTVERANLIEVQRVMSTVGIEVWPGERFRQNYCSKRRSVQLSLAPVYFLKQTPGAQATPATTGTLTMISPSPPCSMYEDQPKCFMQTPSTFPFEWNKSLLIKTRLVSYGSSMLLCTVHMRSFLIGIFKSFTRITVTDFNVTNSTKRESVLPWSNGRHKL
jgi:hypothetical protein